MASHESEESLTATLEGYNSQVQQLEMALGVTTDRATRMELTMLLRDMKELVDLTQDSLLAVKKRKLMAMVETVTTAPVQPTASSMDAEFAAFQAAIADDIAEPTNNTESTLSSHNGKPADSPELEEPVEDYPNPFGDQSTLDYTAPNPPHSDPATSYWEQTEHTDLGQRERQGEEEEEEDYMIDYPNPFGEQGGENGSGSGVQDEDDGLDEILKDIVGARCRVSYSHEWGEQRQHNAMVVCAEPMDGESEPKVRVMFCNPTHRSLVPCPFYLEGRCRFEDDQCRYSHGHIVLVDEIEEFQEVDHSALKLESRCLARYSDDVWYPAVVVEVGEDNRFKVMFEQYDDEVQDVEVEDIVPLDDYTEDGGSEDEASPSRFQLSDEEDESDALPVYLWRPNQTTDTLGDWEKHTKGFGSRIMAKMGYITGQGLGLYGEGRAEPVPIQLLPPGKSLDKIMELKEQAGDQDLYDVMKRNRRKQKGVNAKVAASYKKVVGRERTTFDFINKKLTGKKGNLSDLMRIGPRGSKVERKTIGAHELNKKSDKHINIQLLKTDEEARNVEKEIKRLKESLQRNDGKGGDKGVAAQVRQRLTSMEAYLGQLRSSSSSIQRHKQMRSDHKKYTVF